MGHWRLLGKPLDTNRGWAAHCRCRCGAERIVCLNHLRMSKRQGCASCIARDRMLDRIQHSPTAFKKQLVKSRKTRTKYNDKDRELAQIINAARQRCVNPRHKNYKNYGGRGVRFVFVSVEQAVRWIAKNIGYRPSKNLTIDRIDNDWHYEAGNLRWATYSEQACNTRRTLAHAIPGRMKRLCKLRPDYSYAGLNSAVRRGMSDADILEMKKPRKNA